MATTVISASGKVLIAGGYIVLDPAYCGLVVSTSARFYTVIRSRVGTRPGEIRVRSPQFKDATWIYGVRLDSDELRVMQLESSPSKSPNKFVHLALHRTLLLALERRGAEALNRLIKDGLSIDIVGDNDFYSQRATISRLGKGVTLEVLSQLPPFAAQDCSVTDVNKTGLGSSAALISSLVAALAQYCRLVERVDSEQALIHNLAQYVHCLAQGKIGSGFDVSAAIYGSQKYTRFDPRVLSPIMSDSISGTLLASTLAPTNEEWSQKIEAFGLPPLTRLLLADINAGSDTPTLIRKVLQWRSSNPEQADSLWGEILQSSNSLHEHLESLRRAHEQDSVSYQMTVELASHANLVESGSDGMTIKNFAGARDCMQSIRRAMKRMGEAANTPIEPQLQTDLLDSCVALPGVIGGGVPGAGGFDAVWLLVLDPPQTERADKTFMSPTTRVLEHWSGWKEMEVSPLLCRESWDHGLRVEGLSTVAGLEDSLRIDV